jgi:RNA-directed DNA polymerase
MRKSGSAGGGEETTSRKADTAPRRRPNESRPTREDGRAVHRLLASTSYEWALDGDIKACFDEISHSALLERIGDRVGDRRVLGLVKAFLKAGILTEGGAVRDTITGTPQGGIASPLLAKIALSVLDEHFAERWDDRVERAKRRRHGLPNYRLIRYADDFVVMVSGTKAHAEAVRDDVAAVISPIGLRLSEEKTDVVHIDEGLDFLGWRIQRHTKRGTAKSYVYTSTFAVHRPAAAHACWTSWISAGVGV